jgi:glycosyltransferase involved in cell wall biosynthesis
MDDAADLPLVTVTIPTWNRLPLLREAVASVVAQTYPRWELAVSDDGSTDGTAAWVRGLGDPRIRVVEGPHTGHIGRVRNRGVSAGTGELLAFLDSDDLWYPHTLATMVDGLLAAGTPWLYADAEMIDERGATIPMPARGRPPIGGWVRREVLATEVGVFVAGMLVRREFFERVGGFSEDPRLVLRGDHELAIRLAMHGPAAAIPDVVLRVRHHPTRTTGMADDGALRTALVYTLFLEGHPPRDLARLARACRARHLADAARRRLERGEYAVGARLVARAFVDRPLSRHWLGALVRGVRGRLRGEGRGGAVDSPR